MNQGESPGTSKDFHELEPDPMKRARAIRSLLVERGHYETDLTDDIVQTVSKQLSPDNGARVIARAWTNPEFKEWLLTDAPGATREMGISGLEGEDLVVVENTPDVHNVTVCTLCSCYAWSVMGLPPTWYKQPAYRARIVKQPRRTLAEEFNTPVSRDVEIRVHDVNAETRYMVLPQRPSDADELTNQQLQERVSKFHMIGVNRLLD